MDSAGHPAADAEGHPTQCSSHLRYRYREREGLVGRSRNSAGVERLATGREGRGSNP